VTGIGRRHSVRAVALVGALVVTSGALVAQIDAGGAGATTPAYELYCAGTPVGDVVMNGVVTAGALSPIAPSAKQPVRLTGYQERFSIPAQIVMVAAALGNSSLSGTMRSAIQTTGVRPETLQTPQASFDVPIPSGDTDALAISVPVAPISLGPFTTKHLPVVARVKGTTVITLDISGSTLTMHCRAYPDNSLPTGVRGHHPPARYPIQPVIASSS